MKIDYNTEQKILKIIRKEKTITTKKLFEKSRLDASSLVKILRDLSAVGEIFWDEATNIVRGAKRHERLSNESTNRHRH